MRLIRWLSTRFGSPYESVQNQEEGAHQYDLSTLRRPLRKRIFATLLENERVLYLERHFKWAFFLSYSLFGFMPLVAWIALLYTEPPADHPAAMQGPARFITRLGVGMAVICALMSLSIYTVCRITYVFTSHRILRINEGGPTSYARWDDMAPLSAEQIVKSVAVFNVRGEAQVSPSSSASPSELSERLQRVTFHYVDDVRDVERLVWDAECALKPSAKPKPGSEGQPAAPAAVELPADVRDYLRPSLQDNERVLFYAHPSVWRIALFSCSLTILFLTNLPWLLWFMGRSSPPERKRVFVLISLAGAVASLLVAYIEWTQCRVSYLVTDRAISIYYHYTRTMVSFPLVQLRSVSTWVEKSCAGSITFLFLCDAASLQCMQAERQVGRFVTYHIKKGDPKLWHVPIKDVPKFTETVLAVTRDVELL